MFSSFIFSILGEMNEDLCEVYWLASLTFWKILRLAFL